MKALNRFAGRSVMALSIAVALQLGVVPNRAYAVGASVAAPDHDQLEEIGHG